MRRWTAFVAFVGLLPFAANTAFAQSASSSAETTEEGTYIETMVVTGSRIPRAGFDTMLPATVLDSEFIQARGFTNIADAINEIPTFGVPGNSTQRDQGEFGIGQNFVNLFNLGSQRTLTLVNGRRFVSSNAPTVNFGDAETEGGLQVDLNLIPSSMVERVETIYVGGAPAYGADAIAGTVNIILKDDFEGLEFNGSFGEDTNDYGFKDRSASAIYGINFDNDRGNIVFSVEWNELDGLIESDVDILADGWQFREPPAGSDSEFGRVLVKNAHANIVSNNGVVTPGDTLLPNFGIGEMPNGGYLQFSPDGSLQSYDVGTPTGNAVWSIDGDGLFLPDVVALRTPLERTLVNTFATYDLTDNIELFGEFFWGQTDATEAANQPAYQSGFFGNESFALNFQSDHPLLTQAAQDELASQGLDNFWLQRSSVDLDPTNNEATQKQDLWRVVFGLNGNFEFLDRTFNWDLSYNHGETDANSKQNDISSVRFFYALDVVDTADGPQCRVVADPSSRPEDPGAPFGTGLPSNVFDDCVPLDIFGEGRSTDEARQYITAQSTANTEIKQSVYSANLNFDLFELPGGSLPIALGYEHREEDARFDAGGWASKGIGRSEPVASTNGGYETDELYIEGVLPLFSPDMEIPFLFNASIEGAYRYVDNDSAGDDDIWTIGGRYSPWEDLEIRGNKTRSVRAPSVTELFLPLSGVNSFASDPCDQRFIDEGPNPAGRRANCINGIAGLTPIPDPDNFVSNVANASVQGVTGGNDDLSNETADAWTIGVVLRPRWVENLTVAVDYYNFDIDDAITSFSLTQIMESCYDGASFCDQFTRSANGQLPANGAFQSGFVNADEKKLTGYSLDLDYTLGLGDVPVIADRFNNPGALTFAITGWFPHKDETITGESIQDDYDTPEQAEIQLNWTTRYIRDNWSALWQVRYISTTNISNSDTSTSRDVREINDQYYHNVGATYDWNENLSIQVNVNNVFDNQTPKEAAASGWDYVYDNIGRYVQGSIRITL
jgi:outer membrane receptor protein involved in Fe transport